MMLVVSGTARGQQGEAVPIPSVPGRIAGRVTELGEIPIPHATVKVLGTTIRTTTNENGEYVLAGVPVGPQRIQVDALGHEGVARVVQVRSAAAVTLDFELGEPAVVQTVEEVQVRAERRIDATSSTTRHRVSREEFDELPVDGVSEVVSTKAGVVAQSGTLHFRGGRGSEVKFLFDGVEASDPLFGGAANIAKMAVNNLEILSGGMDAEYGNALSGVVDIGTYEGGEVFGADVRWDTDRFGDPTKTFDNYDRLAFRFAGPTPVRNLTYFTSYEGTFSDTYLSSSLTHSRHTLFDFIQLGNRQFNRVGTNLKLAYRVNSRHKVTLESIRNHTIHTPYEHMWSRRGFVSVTYDTIRTPGEPDAYRPRYGSWSYRQVDATYQPVNLPDHVPTNDELFDQIKGIWLHQLSNRTEWTTRLSRNRFRTMQSVGRKEPWEYWTASPGYWEGNTGPEGEPNLFFATHGDFPIYGRNGSTTYALKSDLLTRRWARHLVKTGIESRYHHVANLSLMLPNDQVNDLPGAARADFVNYGFEAAAYLQDQWEFEGLVVNAGVRYDVFTPGDRIESKDLPSGRRYKRQWSPRLGIVYPISDRDVLSFHYGWTHQTPPRIYLLENRGFQAPVGERGSLPANIHGNPDLDLETSVSYQSSIQHLFAPDVSGQFAVFFKDIYGLISTRAARDEFGNQIARYVNEDYAGSRGFEASVTKSFSHKFSAELNYTYQIATGVESDPMQAQQFFDGGRLYLPISEQPLDWDQRSTLVLQGVARNPGQWGIRLLWQYGSGFPYTPTYNNQRKVDPALVNSRRLPASSALTIDGDKYFKVWGQNVTMFLEVRNVLNERSIDRLSLSLFPNPFLGQTGDEYLIYYTEVGRAGGAYLHDTNADGVLDWVPVHDPRVFQEGRNVRVGIRLDF